MALWQVPAPPVPPDLPVIIHGGGMPEWIGAVAVITVVVAAILLYPLIRALARRLEGKGGSALPQADVDHLHERLGELEQLETRVLELENRVEFSERLLAQVRSEPNRAAEERP